MEGDVFAAYARMADNICKDTLITPQPIEYPVIPCELTKGSADAVEEIKLPQNKQELFAALEKMREAYKPFLRDLAPPLSGMNTVIPLTEFTLDGEKITIPHYDGPMGNATKSYTTVFTLSDFTDKMVYFCCGGADYIATVYINGRCVGIHEGFFSPFEFDITKFAKVGENTLEIVLDNDFAMRGNNIVWDNKKAWPGERETYYGDKIYAATGLGYDDPIMGWHHCPPGMGLYSTVSIEVRNTLNITDLFVRPNLEESTFEAWVEVESDSYTPRNVKFSLSLYGQNFEETVFEDKEIIPTFSDKELAALHGKQVYKLPVKLKDPKVWNPDSPYLYQLQVTLKSDDTVCDNKACQFGMRSFKQDTESEMKGMFYLNGSPIKLRGANTMGFEQLDVMRGDFDQLIDDILLAKLCNMNFWRLTQRPVQHEVYDYCDRLGLMTQTDFPLFGVMRRNKCAEATREVEEMARIIRRHPCNVVATYLNEPWKNAGEKPHRNLLREEIEELFDIFDKTLRLSHPDCVIKHIDGDFDPPTRNSMPDVHCYTLWYNGGQQDFGSLYRGFGQKVAPNWYYGCGEYGVEGLDSIEVMKEMYPKEWMTEPFDPGNIIAAQTKVWHGCFFETPDTMEDWVTATQEHQAFAMKYMTEAYRRDPRMISTAIHLFIDAWPSGWLKSIMDCRRIPKAAYFASRDAFAPLLLSLRSDRFTYYAGEKVSIETIVCNDTNTASEEGTKLLYRLYKNDEIIMHGEKSLQYGACSVDYGANAEFTAPDTDDRQDYVLKAYIVSRDGKTLAQQSFNFTVFADVTLPDNSDVVLITDLENGTHEIAGETVEVSRIARGGMAYFLSRKTGHDAVKGFTPTDFRMWYDKKLDRLAPISRQCFTADGFKPILICNGSYTPKCVVGEKLYEGKRYVICLADLREENPVAKRFRKKLLEP